MMLSVMKAGSKDFERFFRQFSWRVREDADRHTGMGSILSQLLTVCCCQYISILISLTMNMEFFRLLKNILNIRKRDCFLIEYFLRGTIVDQASVVGYGIGLLLNGCQLFYIR